MIGVGVGVEVGVRVGVKVGEGVIWCWYDGDMGVGVCGGGCAVHV